MYLTNTEQKVSVATLILKKKKLKQKVVMEIGIQESEIISSKAEHTGHRPGKASERNAGRARLIHLSVYYISHSF